MAKNFNYIIEETKDAGALYAYCDVFNLHFIHFEKWNSGIALVDLERGKAIFNGQNGKSYIFDEDVPEDWIERQYNKCVDKYSPISSYAASRIKFDNEAAVKKIVAEKKAMDY